MPKGRIQFRQDITRLCETCGEPFTRREQPRRVQRFCSQQCWLKRHNNPERNAAVGRASAEKIRAKQVDKGAQKTYRKYHQRHEHRVVMEKLIGRPLRSDEIVHHKDENVRNNDPSNLELMTRAQHARHHFHGK